VHVSKIIVANFAYIEHRIY